MNTSPDIDSELLASYVAGEADSAQRAQVEHWVAASPGNAKELKRLRAVWSLAEVTGDAVDVDVDAAWNKVKERTMGTPVIRLRPARGAWGWLAAAAAVAALVLVGRMLMTPAPQELMAANEYLSAALNDSSHVVLSPGARIVATMGDERRVQLTGQAYFEVKRDEQHPFIVQAGAVDVTVLGTAFEVTAVEGNDTVRVRVRHGRVGVHVGELDTLILTAGQEARWVKRSNILERIGSGPVERWAGRIIQFNNAPLQQVVEELNEVYGTRIALGNDSIAGCPLTASFGDEPIDEIVRIIAGTFGFAVERTEANVFTLIGDGC